MNLDLDNHGYRARPYHKKWPGTVRGLAYLNSRIINHDIYKAAKEAFWKTYTAHSSILLLRGTVGTFVAAVPSRISPRWHSDRQMARLACNADVFVFTGPGRFSSLAGECFKREMLTHLMEMDNVVSLKMRFLEERDVDVEQIVTLLEATMTELEVTLGRKIKGEVVNLGRWEVIKAVLKSRSEAIV